MLVNRFKIEKLKNWIDLCGIWISKEIDCIQMDLFNYQMPTTNSFIINRCNHFPNSNSFPWWYIHWNICKKETNFLWSFESYCNVFALFRKRIIRANQCSVNEITPSSKGHLNHLNCLSCCPPNESQSHCLWHGRQCVTMKLNHLTDLWVETHLIKM